MTTNSPQPDKFSNGELTSPKPLRDLSQQIVTFTVLMGIFMSVIDSTIINIAMLTLAQAFHTDFTSVRWLITAYLLTVTSLMISAGKLADRWGKKQLYILGFSIFTLASLCCGLSKQLAVLIAMRIFQAIGGSFLIAIGPALILTNAKPQERSKAVGFIGTVVSCGFILGPMLGGFILTHLSWRYIFLLNLPLGLLGVILLSKYLKDEPPKVEHHFDFLGSILLAGGLCQMIIGMQTGRVGLLLAGGLTLGAFVFNELKVKEPLLEVRLFANYVFTSNLLLYMLLAGVLAGSNILMPFYLQHILHLRADAVGSVMMINPLILGITAPVAGILNDKYHSKYLNYGGLILTVIGFYLVSGLTMETPIVSYILRFVPITVGIGLFQTPNNTAILEAVPRSYLNIASSLLSLTRTLGQVSGVALITYFWHEKIIQEDQLLHRLNHTPAPPLENINNAAPQIHTHVLSEIHQFISLAILIVFIGIILTAVYRALRKKSPA